LPPMRATLAAASVPNRLPAATASLASLMLKGG
jgi:hypothetical protein